MATEEAGLELFIDGDDGFNSTLEKLNETLDSLTQAVDSLSEMMDTATVSIDGLSDNLDTLSAIAEIDSSSMEDVSASAGEADDSLADMGVSAEEASEGLDDSTASTEDADSAMASFATTAKETESAFSVASEIIIGGLRKIGEIAVESLLAAGQAFIGFIQDSFQGALDSEEVIAKLNSTIEATGGVAGVTSEAALELAAGFARVTKFSDDAVTEAETLLLTFTNIGNKVFPRATAALLDMATIMGTDAKSGAIQLGKALNNPVEGITALTRVGVTFTAEQEKLINKMVRAGDIAGAQGVILAELEREFGGAAEAAGETFAGKLEILQNRIGEVGEGIAGAFIPIIDNLITSIMPMIPIAEDLAGAFAGFITVLSETGDISAAIDTLGEFESIQTILDKLGISGQSFYATSALIGLSVELISQSIRDAIAMFQNGESALSIFSTVIGDLFGADAGAQVGLFFDTLAAKTLPISMAVTNLQLAFEASMPAIQGAVQLAMTFVQSIWDTVFPSILETTNNTLNQIITLTANILNGIAAFWQQHGNTILAIAVFAFETISATIGGTLALISGVISAALSVINGDWDAAWNALVSGTSAFMNAILSIVGTNLKSFLATWSGVFANLVTIVNTTFINVVSAVSSGILNAIAAAQAILSGFYGIGQAIIDGMVKGVTDAATSLVNAVSDAVSSAIDTAKRVAGIQSPSKLTQKEIGQPLGEGIAVGISDSKDVVANSLTSLLDFGGKISSLASSFGGMFKSREIDAMDEQINGVKDMLAHLDKDMPTDKTNMLFAYDEQAYAKLQERNDLEEHLNDLLAQQQEAREKLEAIESQRQQLDFLKQQMDLLKLINENGLDAGTILGDLQLGVNANVEGILDALGNALGQIVAKSSDALGAVLPQSMTVAPAATAGQMAAQSVYNNSNANSLTINASYPMQSQRSVADDLRLWGMLTGNA